MGYKNPDERRRKEREYYARSPELRKRRKDFYEQTKNSVWRRYSVFRSTAKKFGRDFTLTQEDYAVLVKDNKCHYCGGCLPEVGCGIDRQNNDMGYVHGNVVACCERCNEHKGSLEGVGFRYPRTVELLMELRANV